MQIVYILLTKHEGRTGRILAGDLDSMDLMQRVLYEKDPGPIFSQSDLSKLGQYEIYYTTEATRKSQE